MSERRNGDPVDVLLVEDNPGDVRLTEEAFNEGQLDTTLHVVKDGVEALDFLFRRNETPTRPDRIPSSSTPHEKTATKSSRRSEMTTGPTASRLSS